jgi:hypothetical protein
MVGCHLHLPAAATSATAFHAGKAVQVIPINKDQIWT